jgi:hypothetical protein
MAQSNEILELPGAGMGSFSYVDDTAHGYSNNYGLLSSNFAAHTYQWSSMPTILDGTDHLAGLSRRYTHVRLRCERQEWTMAMTTRMAAELKR